MKVGDIVFLDRDFNNSSKVEVVSIGQIFSTVKSDKKAWAVMTNRLSDNDEYPETPLDKPIMSM